MTREELLGAIGEGLVIGPEDQLVLRLGECSSDDFQRFHDALRHALPEDLMRRVLVVGGAVEQIACIKDGAS